VLWHGLTAFARLRRRSWLNGGIKDASLARSEAGSDSYASGSAERGVNYSAQVRFPP
jgi:hypothetical protein